MAAKCSSNLSFDPEKFSLPVVTPQPRQKKYRHYFSFTNVIYLIAIVFISAHVLSKCPTLLMRTASEGNNGPDDPDSMCPLVHKIVPQSFIENNATVLRTLQDENFKNQLINKLSKAIQIPTEIYDDMPNPKLDTTPEDIYEAYENFHIFLEESFPLIYSKLKIERVNKYALIVTWGGSDLDLKPLLLAAHMDVVPVQKETIKDWTHPPFSGYFDGDYIWGRGATDCKSLLIGLMETFEMLLANEFKPKRTTILAFGYDEEASGMFGAHEINKFLVDRYKKHSFYAIIDEGSNGFEEIEGRKFIIPATGEKGYLDAIIELITPGGHSSVPPDHTAIGIMSALVKEIEKTPYSSLFTNANPLFDQLQCVAQYSHSIGNDLKKDILRSHLDDDANKRVLKYLESQPEYRFFVKTSQAIDVIEGGAKSNALPEHVRLLVNNRIAIESDVNEIASKLSSNIEKIACEFDLGYILEGKTYKEKTSNGYFNFTFMDPLSPAPVTPTNDEEWQLFGGALRHFFEDLIFPDSDEEFIVSPGIMGGNTDTKSYWDLTDHIYRYTPGVITINPHVHSVDEKINFEALLQTVTFFYEYLHILNEN